MRRIGLDFRWEYPRRAGRTEDRVVSDPPTGDAVSLRDRTESRVPGGVRAFHGATMVWPATACRAPTGRRW